ncbi:MAG: isoleucine--tRNA ligase [Magnetococcales bacterium]|nr:isoleucine--tRNA ligase [Magnetococcales bacterium]
MTNASTKKYTVNLPQTEFPMRACLPTQEPKWVKRWAEEEIYEKMLRKEAPKGDFILHCGPPYANGSLHMGHTLSYVLKDFVVRSRAMSGYRTPFVPGWDCHGLPIEWKVEQGLREQGKTKDDVSVKELRDLCRDEADKWINIQREDWRRFGVMADLDHPYLTKEKANEAGIVRAMGDLVATGAIYRGVKSVNWSTVEGTALAEAEIEYADHTSTAIYVAFPMVGNEQEAVVIWTTTPWTLPANRAVAYGDDVEYVSFVIGEHESHAPYINEHYAGKTYWVAKDLVEDFAKTLRLESFETGASRKGSSFAGVKLNHPFMAREVPMLHGDHVTTESGTGFVHTAPAHGAEDFEVGKEAGLELKCPVDGNCLYEPWVDEDAAADGIKLASRNIWDAQEDIVAHMRTKGVLLKAYKYKHSYPISWRSKAPLIFRTTPQWFLELDKSGIRQKALKAIDDIESIGGWIPGSGYKRIRSMIEARPDWCLSRQRSWGVPITIFTNKETGEPLLDQRAFEAVAAKIEKHGIDAWETMSTAELLEGYDYKGDLANLTKETDILDVWFDSGTTWLHVLGQRQELHRGRTPEQAPADLYLEGSDQHRGWFHTSLLTGAAIIGRAPYEKVVTHGFVVDGDGRKMSKSIGNVVAPQELCEKYGMDIVRLWVAQSDYHEDVRISDDILKGTADSYRRLRNTFRYLLGNLSDFNPAEHTVAYDDLPLLEKWVLSRLRANLEQAQADYEWYQFHRVFQALHHFCATELSNLYFDIRKDCLYCNTADNHVRRSCQTVLYALLQGLATHLAPLLAFTMDEVWHYQFGEDAESIHLQPFYDGEASWHQPELETRWETIWKLREDINKSVEVLREQGVVKTNATTEIDLKVTTEVFDAVEGLNLAELLMCAKLEMVEGNEQHIEVRMTELAKCPRCRMHTPDVGEDANNPELCLRCADAENRNTEAAA